VLAGVLTTGAVGDLVAAEDRFERVGFEHEAQARNEIGIE